jgi:hypothetical protein
MPRPKKKGPEFRSSDIQNAKKMLRDYFQQKGGLEYMRNAQQPSMFQDTETGEYIARPQAFGGGGTLKYRSGGMMKYPGGGLFPVRKVTSRQTLRPGMQYEYANPDNRQELIDQGFKFRTTPQGKTVVITPDGDRAVYRDRGELGTELKFKQSMALGGLVKKYQNGGVEGDPNKIDTAIDPTKNVSPRYTDEQVLTLSDFPENEGMQQATSEGKIDAFNFSLPESGSLDDLDDQTKQDILATDFGQEHLSGEGSLDDQYNAYAATVINTINNNPEEALQAINAAIESGNESFQGLKGMSDAEKLQTAKSYMTDKKIGNFHTAFKFDTVSTPKIQMFDPRKIPNMIDRGQNLEPVVVAVGDRAIPNGKAMEFRDAAIEAGIDPSKSSPEFIKFFNTWVEENGFDDARQGIRRNNDNYAFINQGYNLFRDQTRR